MSGKFRYVSAGNSPASNPAVCRWRFGATLLYCAMGYLIGLVLVLLIVPLVFMMLTRRTSGGGGIDSTDRGVTPDRPSSDQPTPRAGPGRDDRIPPG